MELIIDILICFDLTLITNSEIINNWWNFFVKSLKGKISGTTNAERRRAWNREKQEDD